VTLTGPAYIYSATVLNTHDGDTATMVVALGFDVTIRLKCRLSGLNARELASPGGPEARDHLAQMLAAGPVTVESVHWDQFGGRFDAVVYAGGVNVCAQMIADGYASPWNGRGPRPVPPWPIASA